MTWVTVADYLAGNMTCKLYDPYIPPANVEREDLRIIDESLALMKYFVVKIKGVGIDSYELTIRNDSMLPPKPTHTCLVDGSYQLWREDTPQ